MTNQVIDLEYRPREWQKEFHLNIKRWNVAVLHRRAGKTVLAIMTLIDKALRAEPNTMAPSRFGYLAPYLNQSKSIAWGMLKHYASKIPNTFINESELYVRFPHNNATIRLYGADNSDSLRGGYFDFIVLDELKDIKPTVWHQIIQPALADRKGGALLMGTPSGSNLLSEVFYKAQSDDNWYSCLKTVYETDALDPDEIASLQSNMGEAEFAQEFLCSFEAGVDNILLSMADVEEASKRQISIDAYEFSAKVIGIDVARQGSDRSVIYKRQGLVAFEPLVFKNMDGMTLAGAVAQQIEQWQPDAVFIDGSGGYGAGVIDRLRQLGHNVIEVQFGGKASDHRFVNKRSEMWVKMAEWIKTGGAIPNRQTLKVDLTAPTYTHANAAGKLQLEPKDAIKKRIGYSPDEGDGLALTFAFPVAPRSNNLITRSHNKPRNEYNPYERIA
jgi:hypothetical protein